MKAFAGYIILIATVVAPLELRAELLNQLVEINHSSSIWLPNVGAYPGISDGDSFSNQIRLGGDSAGLTSSLIDRSEGRFETSARSYVNFGPPFWWGEWSAGFSVTNASTSHSIGSDGGNGNFLVYSFNTTEPGSLFVRYFASNSQLNSAGAVVFYDELSGLRFIEGINGGVIDVQFNFPGQTPLTNPFEPPYFTQKHALTIAVPGVGRSAGAVDGFASVAARFIWGHGALPGSSPDVPLLPSGMTEDGGFVIDVITEGTVEDVVYIDPVIAIGYDYESASIPFRSVLIPGALPGGDDTFELLFGTLAFTLTAGVEFDFTSFVPDGISEFSIRGIDPSEMLDPTNPTAFVTGVTFMEAGITEVVMTPISVPEPSSLLLALLPMIPLAVTRLRKSNA
ncbi:MAG: hypothetical protein SFX18_10000 [Pirellulales bacterium]|nr:hypothetical protein [Pirellulales bacterium]